MEDINLEHKTKLISESLNKLEDILLICLRHNIDAIIEIRLPGNYTIGNQIKILSKSNIFNEIKIGDLTNLETNEKLNKIKNYFRTMLFKNIKGNFKIKINSGTIEEDVYAETFASILNNPFSVMGNNKIITRLEVKNGTYKRRTQY